MEGWIKLHRKLLENPIFQNEKLLKVFVWCLLKASHTEHAELVGLQKVSLRPGQFVYGRHKAAEELKIKESTLYKYMMWLKNEEILNIQSNNKFSVVTVVNWDLYQIDEPKSNSKNSSKVTTKEQQRNTNKNDKNDKNNINNINNIYNAIFEHWNSKKIIVHKKLTDKIKRKIRGALNTYSPDEIKKAIDNYSTVLTSDEYYWTYKWTLEDFLQRGVEKFLTDACFENYKKDKGISQQFTKAPNKGNFDQRKYDNDYFDKLYKEV